MSFELTAPPCSICKIAGIPVRLLTVKSLMKKDYRDEVKDKAYYLCLDPNCEVAYYTLEGPNDILTKDKGEPTKKERICVVHWLPYKSHLSRQREAEKETI